MAGGLESRENSSFLVQNPVETAALKLPILNFWQEGAPGGRAGLGSASPSLGLGWSRGEHPGSLKAGNWPPGGRGYGPLSC